MKIGFDSVAAEDASGSLAVTVNSGSSVVTAEIVRIASWSFAGVSVAIDFLLN